jgi:hypothetical protein
MQDELKIKLLGDRGAVVPTVMCQKCLMTFPVRRGLIATCPKCEAYERWEDMWAGKHVEDEP